MAIPARIDVEVWCFAFVGCARSWPDKAQTGGLPARIGCHVFRVCESTETLFASSSAIAKLGEEPDETAKSTYLANLAQTQVQAKVSALVSEGFVGNCEPEATSAAAVDGMPQSAEE